MFVTCSIGEFKIEKLWAKSIFNVNHPQRNQDYYEFYNWLIETVLCGSITRQTGSLANRDDDYSNVTGVF